MSNDILKQSRNLLLFQIANNIASIIINIALLYYLYKDVQAFPNAWMYGLLFFTGIGIMLSISELFRLVAALGENTRESNRSNEAYSLVFNPILITNLVTILLPIVMVFNSWPFMSTPSKSLQVASIVLSIITSIYFTYKSSELNNSPIKKN